MNRLVIISTVLCLLACNNRNNRIALKTGFEGQPMPSFNILLTDSTTRFNTSNIAAGQPVVLFYFSPRCPYCRLEMDDMIKNMAQLKNIRFYIVTTWPFHEMLSFYQHYHLQLYQNMTVGADYQNFFIHYFKAQGVPYTAIYGKNKQLNQVFVGTVYAKEIKKFANG